MQKIKNAVSFQKALLKKWTGDDRWSRLRPPLQAMPDVDALAAEVGALDGYAFQG